MNKVKIKNLTLLNFKGIKRLDINFDENTNIYGDNGTGKTTVFDAFTWLLFGKDSSDRKDFEIKTLDENNVVIPKIEHEVTADLLVNGDSVTLKRIFREKWTKTKGRLEAEFTGNETLYYWNDVPLSQKEYQSKVDDILDEKIFKLITSPTAFNSLKWQDRRDVLIKVAGDVSDSDLAKGNDDYMALVAQLSNKSLEELKKQIASTIKKAKDDVKMIPTRIDEVELSKPETVDAEKINKEISDKEEEILHIENQRLDQSKAFDEVIKKRNANQDQIFKYKSRENTIRFEINEKVKNELSASTSDAENIEKQIELKESEELEPAKLKISRMIDEKAELLSKINSYETEISKKREEWGLENAKEFTFNNDEAICPCCNRPLDADTVEHQKSELQQKFNSNKKRILDQINAEGKSLTQKKQTAEADLHALSERISAGDEFILKVENEIEHLKVKYEGSISQKQETVSSEELIAKYTSENTELRSLAAHIAELESITFDLPQQNESLNERRSELQKEIRDLYNMLKSDEQIKASNDRIAELQKEEKMLAQSIADIEKQQYVIESFTKLKIDTIEEKINKKFSFVKFKLFDTQINGGTVECCEALINGVPFSDANTASKINAGIDIINTLCDFYNVSAPIFIDNRESVVKLIDSTSQIINLFVSPEDKKLRIS
ncbi:AAA family ATPase [Chryseobacterium sp. EO14]|uniref:AAA family ATPase n=1 Tax=Chryseobacterium sp. EO14 TaxID=2950551 RepID=UPI00210E25C4|nr:AAA family ATPase [Chryseobacterium sp. EO14]MCQ4139192.1 AAA family ATPase [Chryseobacterium sp. EO14]